MKHTKTKPSVTWLSRSMSWYKSANTTAGQIQQDIAAYVENEAKNNPHGCPEHIRTALGYVATALAARSPEQKITIETQGHLDATSGTVGITARIWP